MDRDKQEKTVRFQFRNEQATMQPLATTYRPQFPHPQPDLGLIRQSLDTIAQFAKGILAVLVSHVIIQLLGFIAESLIHRNAQGQH